ncbi:MAG: porin [Candidatus Latescibacteria bacterium]|nr:porin [Candidatus Latescibacterota bacterium]
MYRLLACVFSLLLAAMTSLVIPGPAGAQSVEQDGVFVSEEAFEGEEEEEGFFDEWEEESEGGIEISGYADFAFFTGGADGEEGESSFKNRHLYIMVAGQLSDKLAFEAEIKGTYLQGTWDMCESATLTFGKILVPFGRWHHMDLGDVKGKLGPTFWAEPGVMISGAVYPLWDIPVNYALYTTNGLNKNLNAQDSDNNGSKAIGGRVAVSPFGSLEIGASGYSGKWSPDDKEELRLLGVDGNYSIGPLNLSGEYAEAQISDSDQGDYGKSAFYVQGSYGFFGKCEGVVRYSEYENDDTVVDNKDVHQTLVRLRYSPVGPFSLQAEYQWNMEAIKEKDDDRFQLLGMIMF